MCVKVSGIPETLAFFVKSFLYTRNYCIFYEKFLVYWKLLRYFVLSIYAKDSSFLIFRWLIMQNVMQMP